MSKVNRELWGKDSARIWDDDAIVDMCIYVDSENHLVLEIDDPGMGEARIKLSPYSAVQLRGIVRRYLDWQKNSTRQRNRKGITDNG